MDLGKTSAASTNAIRAVRLGLAGPDDILGWSSGEVTQPTTYHVRSRRPEPGGLFCERLFGPVQDWRCRCGKYDGPQHQGLTCERCGTRVLHSRARRQRLGHIDLAAPVVHPWFFRRRSCPLAALLGLRRSDLEQVVYGQAYVVRRSGPSQPEIGQVLDARDYQAARARCGPSFEAITGAAAILFLLRGLDLPALSCRLRAALAQAPAPQQQALLRRLRVVEALRESGQPPEWMVLQRLPVLPPALRPVVPLPSGKLASSDLNDLYRRLLHRNNRLKRLLPLDAPERILLNEQRLLQQAVDALFDNRRSNRPVEGPYHRPLRSLTDLLTGKSGRFRGNLLGKRVDYSARAVIVVGPELKLHQCGLPRAIALKLYEPFLVRRLLAHGQARTIRKARQLLDDLGNPALPGRTAALAVRELAGLRALEHARQVLEEAGAGLPEKDRERALANAQAILAQWNTPEARGRSEEVFRELGPQVSLAEASDRLRREGPASTRRWLRSLLQARRDRLWGLLEEVTRNHPVLLNRAPTLHRLGIQAFEPVLVEGNAIRLHPLVCKAFNADFDGDQMAIHLPLSLEARVEAAVLMMAPNNLFNPANGQPILTPSQDIVLGCSYLTARLPDAPLGPRGEATGTEASGARAELPPPVQWEPPATDQGGGRTFAGPEEVLLAHALGKVGTHARIRVRLPAQVVLVTARGQSRFRPGGLVPHAEFEAERERLRARGEEAPQGVTLKRKVVVEGREDERIDVPANGLIETTVGRVLFNALLPPQLPFYDLALSAKRLSRIVTDCYREAGPRTTADFLDRVKQAGFQEATRSGLSFATDDLPRPRGKEALLQAAQRGADRLQAGYRRGDLSADEYALNLLTLWSEAQRQVTARLLPDLEADTRAGRPYLNPLFVMAASGARGNQDQVRQLAGMRGLMASVSGKVIGRPVTASLREGLPSWDYFLSAYGARKGLTDKGLRTAEAGYLTRKLADVAQHVVVSGADCGTPGGVVKRANDFPQNSGPSLATALRGRVSREAITGADGRVVVRANEMIGPEQARALEALGMAEVLVRSPLTCRAARGICRLCYGMDLATGRLAEEGLAVGILAAQSIGEPGTQLTLRTFHIGGLAGKDIVNDLERVTRLLEASRPAEPAVLARVSGLVRVGKDEERSLGRQPVWVQPLDGAGRPAGPDSLHLLPAGREARVRTGEQVNAGTPLTDGPVDPGELLEVAGPEAVQEYLLGQVREVYRHHGLEIDDKHFEVILAQLLRKVKVQTAGDTGLLVGQVLDRCAFQAANAGLLEWVKILSPGDSTWAAGERVRRADAVQECGRLRAEDRRPPVLAPLESATCRPTLLGLTRAAVEADSFIAAASFQRTAEVLTEAALAGRTDPLEGLKENVILGQAIPAGTGLRALREARVRVRPPRPAREASPAKEESGRAAATTVRTKEDA